MANKNKKSSYYWFMLEIAEEYQRRGQPVGGGLARIAEIARPKWNAMSAEQRKPYEDKAREFKNSKVKYDNHLNPIHLRSDPLVDYDNDRLGELKAVISAWPESLEGVSTVEFCVIDFQVIGKVELSDNSVAYLPAEVAVSKFSLRDGIIKCFHQFIKPPPIPTGGRYTCQSHTEATHRIPLEGHPEAIGDYWATYDSIMSLVDVGRPGCAVQPFYVPMANYECTMYCLDWMYRQGHTGAGEPLHCVYELESLVMSLTFKSSSKTLSKKSVTELLTTSEYHYSPGMKCLYHDELECFHCSLSFVKQYSYAICQFLGSSFNVELDSRHLPKNSDICEATSVLPVASAAGPSLGRRPDSRQKKEQSRERSRMALPTSSLLRSDRDAMSGDSVAGSRPDQYSDLSQSMESMILASDRKPSSGRGSVAGLTSAGQGCGGAVALRHSSYAVASVPSPRIVQHGRGAAPTAPPLRGVRPLLTFSEPQIPRPRAAAGQAQVPWSAVRPPAYSSPTAASSTATRSHADDFQSGMETEQAQVAAGPWRGMSGRGRFSLWDKE